MCMYTQLEEHYLKMMGVENILGIIEESVAHYNSFIDMAVQCGYAGYAPMINHGRSIGPLMEMEIASRLGNVNGFKFRQGKESSNDKDFECIEYGHRFNKKFAPIIGNIYDPHNYGIELKCSTKKYEVKPTGNRSFAVSDNKMKSKDSFYICLSRICANQDTKFHIASYQVWFIYVEQRDWLPCREGGGSSCSIMSDVWKDRAIRLK